MVADDGRATGRIFISYRRADVPHAAGRLFDRLEGHFGVEKVFVDVASIEPGANFDEAITRAVGTCDVLLAVIGKGWLVALDDGGRRRLDDPADLVAVEIDAALQRGIRVIPVLVDGAELRADALPEPLAPLGRRQAFEIGHKGFRSRADELIATLERGFATAWTEPEGDAPAAGDDGSAEPAADPEHPITDKWAVEDFVLLLRDPRASAQQIGAVLDVLAEDPGTYLSTSDLVGLTGMSRNQLRGTFSGFSRVCQTLRPDTAFWWPIEWTWGPSNHAGRGRETFYQMSSTVAERWKQARATAS
jgi:hypothetical protein